MPVFNGASYVGPMAKAAKQITFLSTAYMFDHQLIRTAHSQIALETRHLLQQKWQRSGNALARNERQNAILALA